MWWIAVSAFAGDPATVVKGTVQIDPTRVEAVKGAAALFVSVRDPAGGPPLAALKLPVGPFPLALLLTEANAIAMGGAPRPFPAKVDLSVRLDADGDPLTKDDGLPAALMPGIVLGTTDLAITLK